MLDRIKSNPNWLVRCPMPPLGLRKGVFTWIYLADIQHVTACALEGLMRWGALGVLSYARLILHTKHVDQVFHVDVCSKQNSTPAWTIPPI